MTATALSPEIRTVASLSERCDRCSAAAKLEVTVAGGGSLAFCGHHSNKHAADIARVAARVELEEGFGWVGGVPTA
ncbi:hypothetical protein [Krasilnikovia sp. MM14-A1259]|uniref:DUF7455 domain-containing protein n=1 Tax=Krasilnikovia sp. MM14-A1259 TaxID=3373539 RepID=UPI00380D5DEF